MAFSRFNIVALFGVVFALAVISANAATINVDSQADDVVVEDNSCSLREAIENAQGSAHTDCEDPGMDNPVVINLPSGEIFAANLPFINVNIDFTGSGSVITGRPRPGLVAGARGIFWIDGAVTVRMTGDITVQYGQTNQINQGGCISVHGGARLVLDGTTIRECRAEIMDDASESLLGPSAGGVFVDEDCGVEIRNALFENNSGHSFETGALDNQGSYFDPNTVLSSPLNHTFAAGGLFIGNRTDEVIEDTVFRNNIADVGGAIASYRSLQLQNCVFTNNSAIFTGGAVFSLHSLTVYGTGAEVVSNNRAADGGAFFALQDIEIRNIGDVSDNVAYIYAGGVAYAGADLHLHGAGAFVGNRADFYGGIFYAQGEMEVHEIGGIVENGYVGMEGLFFASEIIVEGISGSISDNVGAHGSIAYSFGSLSFDHISGDITNNFCDESSLFFALEDIHLTEIEGSISNNQAAHGTLIAYGANVILHDLGDLTNNVIGTRNSSDSSDEGSLFRATGSIIATNIGNVEDNIVRDSLFRAEETITATYLGVFDNNVGHSADYASLFNGDSGVVINHIGAITNNENVVGGGLVYSGEALTILDVQGSISDNIAIGEDDGDAFFSDREFILRDVDGEITNNVAQNCFLHAEDNLYVENVNGQISYNRIGLSIFYGVSGFSLKKVNGSLSHNINEHRDADDTDSHAVIGLVIDGGISVDDINGDISFNTQFQLADSKASGSIFFASSGFVEIHGIAGSIEGNFATTSGFIYASEDVHLENVQGNIHDNFGEIQSGFISSGDEVVVSNINGNITHNQCNGFDADRASAAFVLASESVILEKVAGNIVDNLNIGLNDGSGLIRSTSGSIMIRNIEGDISRNTGSYGSVAYADESVVIQSVAGSICDNNVLVSGGVGHSDANNVYIEFIAGDICRNLGTEGGGVAYAFDSVLITNIEGDIVDNFAGPESASSLFADASTAAGVAFAFEGSVTIQHVTGSVSRNVGPLAGVAWAEEEIVIRNIGGEIAENLGELGAGVAYSLEKGVEIANIHGSLRANNGKIWSGIAYGQFYTRAVNIQGDIIDTSSCLNYFQECAAFTTVAGEIDIRNVTGSISNNRGGVAGLAYAISGYVYLENIGGDIGSNFGINRAGVAYSTYAVSLRNLGGSIIDNHSALGLSAVFYGEEGVLVEKIRGSILNNVDASWEHGAPFHAFTGPTVIRNIGGSISNNRGGGAGVAYGDIHVEISNVAGDISDNFGAQSSGVFYSDYTAAIFDIHGDIHHNTVGNRFFRTNDLSDNYISSVGCATGLIEVHDIFGSIHNNTLEVGEGESSGGVFFSKQDSVDIHDVSGSLSDNYGANGGIAYGHKSVVIKDIAGDICNNYVTWFGAVAYCDEGSIQIKNIQGNICDNKSFKGPGGIAYADESLELLNIGGSIYNNQAHKASFGAPLQAQREVHIQDVAGSIHHNRGGRGGVAYGGYGVFIRDIAGDIASNFAHSRGGVAYAQENIEVLNVGGSISENHCELDGGGAFYSVYATKIHSVGGNIHGNHCPIRGDGSETCAGGFVFAQRHIEITDVSGDIYDNYASYGGLAYSETEFVEVNQIDGSIYDQNSRAGGVIYAADLGSIRNVGGSIRDNTAFENGGVVLSRHHLIENINGSIIDNTALMHAEYGTVNSGGGVACGFFPDSNTVFKNIKGDISRNSGRQGGVVYSMDITITGVAGVISDNTAYYNGGAFYAYDNLVVSNVGGIIGNRAIDRDGGAFYAFQGDASITNVNGDIINNKADFRDGIGGLVYAGGDVVLRNVVGSISGQSAGLGSVVFASGTSSIEFVSGSITDNVAGRSGGVSYATNGGHISNVDGDISSNHAISGSGGVFYGAGDLLIRDVKGSIIHNSASMADETQSPVARDVEGDPVTLGVGFGGVLYSLVGDATILNVGVDVSDNSAGSGGVVFAAGDAVLSSVGGSVSDNVAMNSGGVLFARSASIKSVGHFISNNDALLGYGGVMSTSVGGEILWTGEGICGNAARYHGGVQYTLEGSLLIEHDSARLTQNEAKLGQGSVQYCDGDHSLDDELFIDTGKGIITQNVDSTGALQFDALQVCDCTPDLEVVRGVEISVTATVTVSHQPVDVAANECMDPAPAVNVTGVTSSLEIPIDFRIEVVPEDDPPYIYPNEVETVALPNGHYSFPCISLPSGTYRLRFQIVGGCTDNTILAEDISEEFVVSGCEDPWPVVCPDEEIIVSSNSFTCDAYTEVPDAQGSADCDNAIYTNTFNSVSKLLSDRVPGTASDVYPVGSTDFELQVSAGSNSYSCPMRVTVLDEVAPSSVSCPLNQKVSAAAGQCSASVSLSLPTAVDNCPITFIANDVTTVEDASGEYRVGTHEVTFTVGNDGPSAECTTIVTVLDEEAPVITCPADITATCENPVVEFQVFASDNCDGVLQATPVGNTFVSGSSFPDGVTEQSFSAIDASGNSATCNFFVTVQSTYFRDHDGDGFGSRQDTTGTVFECDAPANWALTNDDCNDFNANAWKIWFFDFDGDGFGNPAFPVCTDNNGTIPADILNGVDAIIPGVVPTLVLGELDDPSTYDCDDTSPFVFPRAPEVCDFIDNNCNGEIDEGLPTCPAPPGPETIIVTVDVPFDVPNPVPVDVPVPNPVPQLVPVAVGPQASTTTISVNSATSLALSVLAIFASVLAFF